MSVSLRLGESLVSGAVLGYTVTVLLYLYIVHNVCIQVFRPRVVITKQPSPILEIIHKSITNLFLTLSLLLHTSIKVHNSSRLLTPQSVYYLMQSRDDSDEVFKYQA